MWSYVPGVFISIVLVGSTHVMHVPKLHFYLSLSNIPLSCLSICQLVQHLGCFHVLAVIYNAAMSIWIQGLCEHMFPVLLGGYLGVGLLSHLIRGVYLCKKLPNCFVLASLGGLALPSAQDGILKTRDRVPRQTP